MFHADVKPLSVALILSPDPRLLVNEMSIRFCCYSRLCFRVDARRSGNAGSEGESRIKWVTCPPLSRRGSLIGMVSVGRKVQMCELMVRTRVAAATATYFHSLICVFVKKSPLIRTSVSEADQKDLLFGSRATRPGPSCVQP